MITPPEMIIAPPPKKLHFYGLTKQGILTHLGCYRDQRGLHRAQTNFIRSNCCHVIQSEVPLTAETMVIWSAPDVALTPRVATVTPDTQPPTVEWNDAKTAQITNFPVATPHTWRCVQDRNGWLTDPVTGQSTSNHINVSFYADTNHFYQAWWSSNLVDWNQLPDTWSGYPQPAHSNTLALPVLATGKRFYSLRNTR